MDAMLIISSGEVSLDKDRVVCIFAEILDTKNTIPGMNWIPQQTEKYTLGVFFVVVAFLDRLLGQGYQILPSFVKSPPKKYCYKY